MEVFDGKKERKVAYRGTHTGACGSVCRRLLSGKEPEQSTEIVLGENQTLEEVRIKTINGNEMTYEQDGEIVSIRIVQG